MWPTSRQTLVLRDGHGQLVADPRRDHHSYQTCTLFDASIETASGSTEALPEVTSETSEKRYALQRFERSPSPRIYLDDNVVDRFSTLPLDLPQEVVTEQLYNCEKNVHACSIACQDAKGLGAQLANCSWRW
jgi:hypothetical protein